MSKVSGVGCQVSGKSGFQVSGVSAAAGLKSGQSNRKRNFGLALAIYLAYQAILDRSGSS